MAAAARSAVSARCLWFVGLRAAVLAFVIYAVVMVSVHPVLRNTQAITGYSRMKRPQDQLAQLDEVVHFSDRAVPDARHHGARPKSNGRPVAVSTGDNLPRTKGNVGAHGDGDGGGGGGNGGTQHHHPPWSHEERQQEQEAGAARTRDDGSHVRHEGDGGGDVQHANDANQQRDNGLGHPDEQAPVNQGEDQVEDGGEDGRPAGETDEEGSRFHGQRQERQLLLSFASIHTRSLMVHTNGVSLGLQVVPAEADVGHTAFRPHIVDAHRDSHKDTAAEARGDGVAQDREQPATLRLNLVENTLVGEHISSRGLLFQVGVGDITCSSLDCCALQDLTITSLPPGSSDANDHGGGIGGGDAQPEGADQQAAGDQDTLREGGEAKADQGLKESSDRGARDVQADGSRSNDRALHVAAVSAVFLCRMGDGTRVRTYWTSHSGSPFTSMSSFVAPDREEQEHENADNMRGRGEEDGSESRRAREAQDDADAKARQQALQGIPVARWDVQLEALDRPLVPSYLITLVIRSRAVTGQGSVRGSPFIQRNALMFLGLEHPLSANGRLASQPDTAVCGVLGLPPIAAGSRSRRYTTVAGAYTEPALVHKAFWRYLTAVRASRPRPFLHYNSWFDFYSWQEENSALADRTMTEASCLHRVNTIATELVQKRGVQLDSFLWDDGWDDTKSLWSFHKGFPNGFTPVSKAAGDFKSGIGVWISPWGGYGEAKQERLLFGRRQGYETNEAGFSLSGPKYFDRFSAIALEMVTRYGVNMFKFDGISFGDGSLHEFAAELEGMLSFLRRLRRTAKSELWINLTTGMWPSPFWLLYGDSIWRGFGDLGLHGDGSLRQQWVTYRDAVVYKMVVSKASLFPLSALMLHGIVTGAVGEARHLRLNEVSNMMHFKEEVWSYFAMGVQLQELYISPDTMTATMWDVVAAAASWARERAPLLQHSRWVGGDAVDLQVYGFGSWLDNGFVLLLRNPRNTTRSVELPLGRALGLPSSLQAATYSASCRFSNVNSECQNMFQPQTKGATLSCSDSGCALHADETYRLELPGLGMVLLEGERVQEEEEVK